MRGILYFYKIFNKSEEVLYKVDFFFIIGWVIFVDLEFLWLLFYCNLLIFVIVWVFLVFVNL